MSTHPFIPLYVDDYDAATAHLTAEEDGVYSRLIRLCWRTPGCSLPNDPVWIARKIRLTSEDYARVAAAVVDEFFTIQRGRLVQRRLKREYDDITRKKSARRAAGKKGGEAKALKTRDNPPSNAKDLPAHTRAFPEPEPEPESQVVLFPERSVKAETQQPAKAGPRGSRLTSDWRPSEELLAYAKDAGFTEAEIARIADDFRDYWIAQPGSKGVKVDWPATWRRWVRTQAERRPRQPAKVDWC